MKTISRYFWYDVEDEFGILITPEEQRRTQTYGDLLHLIQNKTGTIPLESDARKIFQERAIRAVADCGEVPAEKVRLSDSLGHALQRVPDDNDLALIRMAGNVDFMPLAKEPAMGKIRAEQGGMALFVLLIMVIGILFTEQPPLQTLGAGMAAFLAVLGYGFWKADQQKKAAYQKILVSDVAEAMLSQFFSEVHTYPKSVSQTSLEQQLHELLSVGYDVPTSAISLHANLIRDLHLEETETDKDFLPAKTTFLNR